MMSINAIHVAPASASRQNFRNAKRITGTHYYSLAVASLDASSLGKLKSLSIQICWDEHGDYDCLLLYFQRRRTQRPNPAC